MKNAPHSPAQLSLLTYLDVRFAKSATGWTGKVNPTFMEDLEVGYNQKVANNLLTWRIEHLSLGFPFGYSFWLSDKGVP